MNLNMDAINSIHGFLDPNEAQLLYRLASEVPAGGVIVEIGSYEGRSTICLGKGAKVNGANVWAIDPYFDYMVDQNTHYGMEHHAALLKNLVDYGVADTVRVVALSSVNLADYWLNDIDLLFIDGNHEHQAVAEDFRWWSREMKRSGLIAFHDYTNPLWPGVAQVVNKAVASGEWEIVERADATVVIKRVAK